MKRLFFLLILIGIVFSCSESDEPTTPACKNDFASGITISHTYAYTREEITITGNQFCKNSITNILINDTEVVPVVTTTSIKFTIPAQEFVDSASVKVKTVDGIVDLRKKIKIFPFNGEWTEVAPFPDQGRGWMLQMVDDNLGYLAAGEVYTGYSGGYNHTYFNSLYQYNPATNSWSMVDSNDSFKNKEGGTSVGGKFFLTPVTILGGVTTYQVNTKATATTGSYSSNAATKVPFSIGSDAYLFVGESPKKLVIKKYNTSGNSWVAATELTYTTDSSPLANFAFEYEGVAYIGYNPLNSSVLNLLTYNPVSNVLAQSSMTPVSGGGSLLLHHLFTINGLAYFIERGSSSIGPSSASIASPSSKLYIYNLKAGSWTTATHSYPENFYGINSFSISNRGFAGLSISVNGILFSYSQKFYEFKPKW